jgi:formamidopyrimidine-DNA glycosylase
MPELPEVETIVCGLKRKILGRKTRAVWSDFKKMIKRPNSFEEFKKEVIGGKIKNVRRRGKNILIDLSQNKTLLIHQKLTGHLLLGKWKFKKNQWISQISGPLFTDPMNRFLHLIFFLDNGQQLALSDLRKFAKVELWSKKELESSRKFGALGPEPLEKNFTLKKFQKALEERKGKIKQILMNQEVIAGIGNIYSDEILWQAKVNPLKDVQKLRKKEIKAIYEAMRKILKKAIELKGDSMRDFRLITGEKGKYQEAQKVYQQEGRPCQRKDGGTIKRVKIGGRSARFCPICQKS